MESVATARTFFLICGLGKARTKSETLAQAGPATDGITSDRKRK